MGAFAALQNYYDVPLHVRAQQLGYHVSNVYILLNDERGLRENCPDIYQNLITCRHNRDNRTIMEYGQDMVASWIFEDDLIEKLQEAGLDIVKSGADKERLILATSNVSSGSDTKVRLGGRSVFMEIMCDYKGYWTRYHRADLRDNKCLRLQREKALFLGVDVANKKYMLIDFADEVQATYNPSHFAYGGKPVYSFDLKNYRLKEFDYDSIARDIIALI